MAALRLSLLLLLPVATSQEVKKAYFAMGCFWCGEADFEKLGCDEQKGISNVISGFTGGHVANPSYREVVTSDTGHFEAIRLDYASDEVPYEALLEHFWKNVDPTDNQGQFCDKGDAYRSAIFYDGPEQQAAAEASMEAVRGIFGVSQVVTELLPFDGAFYDAEAVHQDFWRSCIEDCTLTYGRCCEDRYEQYRTGCGRDTRLGGLWGEQQERSLKEWVATRTEGTGWSGKSLKQGDSECSSADSDAGYLTPGDAGITAEPHSTAARSSSPNAANTAATSAATSAATIISTMPWRTGGVKWLLYAAASMVLLLSITAAFVV